MKLTREDAKALAIEFLVGHGMPADHAGIVADHLVYATMTGHAFAGLPRLPAIGAELRRRGPGGQIRTVHETDKSALIDGADVIGYVTSLVGIDKAVELARRSGVGIVGVNGSWFSGLLRYYVERAAQAGMIAVHAANGTARVAPHGGIDRLLGTNPIAFAFPTEDQPLVIDLATSSISWGDVLYHQQTGKPLPEGRTVDGDGYPTLDPVAALAGAFLPWGGPRGSGLSVVVQILGMLGGSDPIVTDAGRWGYFFLAFDPALLMPADEFRARAGMIRDGIESSRPEPGGAPVRAPGSGGQRRFQEGLARGWIEVADEVYEAVRPDARRSGIDLKVANPA